MIFEPEDLTVWVMPEGTKRKPFVSYELSGDAQKGVGLYVPAGTDKEELKRLIAKALAKLNSFQIAQR